MKYFAVAVIFGLVAFTQAMPVEESREKRFNPFLIGIFNVAKSACNGITSSGQPVDPLVTKICDCISAAGNIGGILGGILGDESPEEKRFFFKPNIPQLIQQVKGVVDGLCKNATPDFADLCRCIQF